MEFLVGIITIAIGFYGSQLRLLGWYDAGAIFSIAFIGSIILWQINHKK